MKKAVLVFSALSAMAGAASAQSAVTIYGLVDMGIVVEGGGAAGRVTKMTSGVSAGSRLGFKGTEDLGGGLSALFVLENGFQADTGALGQGGLIFGRQAFIGLQGQLGTVTLGRQYTPEYLTVAFADPFGSGTAGDSKNLIAPSGNGSGRMDNSIKYVSKNMGGVSVELAYGAGEISDDSAAGRQLGAALTYAAGPLSVRFGYHNRNNDTAKLKNTDNAKNAILAATYDFGVAKAYVAYGTDKGLNSALLRNAANPFAYAVAPTPSTDSSDILVGVNIPFGANQVMASYIRKNDKTKFNQDADQVALGYRYLLSKRSDIYTAFSRIKNSGGAGYTVGGAIEGGTGDWAFNLGLRHTF